MVVFSDSCYCPQSYVIVHRGMLLYTNLRVCFCPCGGILRPMLSFKDLFYLPQSYIIINVVVFSDPCYHPQSYVIIYRGMLLSTELRYHPQVYVIVQGTNTDMLSSMGLCYRPEGYVLVHRAMLSFMWWCSQTLVIFNRAMLSSIELCYCPQG